MTWEPSRQKNSFSGKSYKNKRLDSTELQQLRYILPQTITIRVSPIIEYIHAVPCCKTHKCSPSPCALLWIHNSRRIKHPLIYFAPRMVSVVKYLQSLALLTAWRELWIWCSISQHQCQDSIVNMLHDTRRWNIVMNIYTVLHKMGLKWMQRDSKNVVRTHTQTQITFKNGW